MVTYLVLNIVFILVICILARVKIRRPFKAIIFTMIALLILTALFDNLIVGFSIVNYDNNKILGIRIGEAPIEDFAYAFLAVILVPFIWLRLGKKNV
ncbi:MAG: lycopene cyclase domain-containing protein [Candidatus Saccharimonadales bacterium]